MAVLIIQWFNSNLDIVFFIYGFAFVIMGISIIVQPRRESEFEIAGKLWLLALFGLIHGVNEHFDMWALIKGKSPFFDIVRWSILVVSYVFLFEFGRGISRIIWPKISIRGRTIAGLLGWWLSPAIVAFIFIYVHLHNEFWEMGAILARYLLGLPGGILTGLGFLLYYRYKKDILDLLKAKKYFLLAGISFLIYGVLGGIVVSRGDFFPANWINTQSFLTVVKIPVQVFRSVCAIASTFAIVGVLRIFNWEVRHKIQEAKVQLEKELVEHKGAEERLKIAYQQLKEAQSQLIQAEKMEIVGTIASGVAHEVKNPLAIILQSIEYISKKVKRDDENISLMIEDIKEAVERADKIIKGLLDFSSTSKLSMDFENLNSVIEGSLHLIKSQLLEARIEVIKNLGDIPPIKMDKNRIEQALIDLFINAMNAMPNGGKLIVGTFSKELGKEERVIIVQIEDSGHGIPEGISDKIFNPFFTTRQKEGGTGLGLSIVKNIIEQHNGKIEIQNKKEERGVIAEITFKAL